MAKAADVHFIAIARYRLRNLLFPLGIYVFSVSLMFGMAGLIFSSPFVLREVIIPTYQDLPPLSGKEAVLLGPWQHWDGMWYLKIATHGYAYEDFSLAFFPAYPLLIRLVGDVLGTIYLFSAVLISATCYATGLIFLYKLARLEGGERFARRSVLYLAFFPTAFFFLAVYTESLFLALSVSAFYFARKGRWTVAGVLGMVATLTRSTGLILVVPFVIEYLSQKRFRLREMGLEVGAILLIPFGAAAYSLYNWWAFGDPVGFLAAQNHWERHIAFPWDTIRTAVALSLTDSSQMIYPSYSSSLIWQLLKIGSMPSSNIVDLAFFILTAALLFLGFRRLRAPYTIYAALALLVPLCDPSQILPLLSTPRFVLVLFPISFVLAQATEKRVVHVAVLAVYVVALVVLTARFAAGYWIA